MLNLQGWKTRAFQRNQPASILKRFYFREGFLGPRGLVLEYPGEVDTPVCGLDISERSWTKRQSSVNSPGDGTTGIPKKPTKEPSDDFA